MKPLLPAECPAPFDDALLLDDTPAEEADNEDTAESLAAAKFRQARSDDVQKWARQFHTNVKLDGTAALALVTEAYQAIRAKLSSFIGRKSMALAATTGDPATTQKDLVSVAENALYLNLKRWSPARHGRFSMTVTRTYIQSEMSRCLNQEIRLVNYPDRVATGIFQLQRARRSAVDSDQAERQFLEEARRKWGRGRARTVLHHKNAFGPELVIDDNRPEDDGPTRVGYYTHSVGPQINDGDCAALLEKILPEIDQRLRATVEMYFGIGREPLTYGEIGRQLGVTGERARQRVVQALVQLKRRLLIRGVCDGGDVFERQR